MNLICISLLAAAMAADSAASSDNPVLASLLSQGVATRGQANVKLAAPIMPDGLDAAGQTKALTRIAGATPLEHFLQRSSAAPIYLKVHTIRGPQGKIFRTIDLGFVAHGSWTTLVSDKFSESMFKTRKKQDEEKGRTVSKLGFLTADEIRSRDLKPAAKPGREERYFYTTFLLFDLVEVSATRDAVVTKTSSSIVLAARVDPRFAHDADYPNQWRSVERDAAAKLVYGKPQPYSGAGFYVKLTRLTQPDDAIFVEYHSAFLEPEGWFEGQNVLRSKLPAIAQHEATQFRGKLAKASLDEGEKPAAGGSNPK